MVNYSIIDYKTTLDYGPTRDYTFHTIKSQIPKFIKNKTIEATKKNLYLCIKNKN